MTRVSENSGRFALNYAVSKAKQKLEDLQIKGSTLKRISKPSDNPVGNVDYLSVSSRMTNKNQYLRNASVAINQLEFTERALEDLTNVLMKAKEIAIAQSSDLYNPKVRENVAKEVAQLKNEAIAIANRRLGNRFIFSGHSTLTRPFSEGGKYFGDEGRISLEVAKDFFVPINLHGKEVFFISDNTADKSDSPLSPFKKIQLTKNDISNEGGSFPEVKESENETMDGRKIASVEDPENQIDTGNIEDQNQYDDPNLEKNRENIFSHLSMLQIGLETNDSQIIRDLLEKVDTTIEKVVTFRTKVGAVYSSILNAKGSVEKGLVEDASYKSQLVDADVAELYSDLAKQQNVLQATYKSGHAILNKNLLDFLH